MTNPIGRRSALALGAALAAAPAVAAAQGRRGGAMPPVVIYHLEGRRSERLVWLMEELGLPYRLEFKRGDLGASMAAIRALSPIVPMAPTVQYGDQVLVHRRLCEGVTRPWLWRACACRPARGLRRAPRRGRPRARAPRRRRLPSALPAQASHARKGQLADQRAVRELLDTARRSRSQRARSGAIHTRATAMRHRAGARPALEVGVRVDLGPRLELCV